MKNQNFLEHTLAYMEKRGKKPEDVRKIGCKDANRWTESWEDFAAKAAALECTDSLGYKLVAQHLLIVGDNWWLTWTVTGSEGAAQWLYQEVPQMKEDPKALNFISGWRPYLDAAKIHRPNSASGADDSIKLRLNRIHGPL